MPAELKVPLEKARRKIIKCKNILNKLHSPFEVTKHLSITQKFSKVDVEQMTRCLKHDIVIVAITDPQDVCCNTVSST